MKESEYGQCDLYTYNKQNIETFSILFGGEGSE
jgi:hypothetical protein